MSVHDCPCRECEEDEDLRTPEELEALRVEAERQCADEWRPARSWEEQVERDVRRAAMSMEERLAQAIYRDPPAERMGLAAWLDSQERFA